MSNPICPECGARLAAGAERCDLCGASIDVSAGRAVTGGSSEDPTASGADIPEPGTKSEKPAGGVYCNQCGRKNPLDARFCSQCGSRLQAIDASGAAAPDKPPSPPAVQPSEITAEEPSRPAEIDSDSGLSRYVGVLIGLAVLIVVALYMITVVSKQNVSAERNAAGVAEAPADVRSAAVIEEHESIPIQPQFAATVDSFRAEIEQAEGVERRQVQRGLVDYFVRIGRIDRAAIEQQRLAARSDEIADWRMAGDLHYDWLETVSDERKRDVALLAIDAYERVLDKNPGDLDVRADLGWVYQFDPENPMQAIQQTNRVLESDPSHLAANYNRGVFLLRINRLSDALEQFEKVKELASAESAYYRQADMWIETVRRQ